MGAGVSVHEALFQGLPGEAPGTQGKDLEITRTPAEFKRIPVTVVNYLEGTRFSERRRPSNSRRYRHLLKPKAGGVAFVLAALGEQLDALLDVTVVYPSDKGSGILGPALRTGAEGDRRHPDLDRSIRPTNSRTTTGLTVFHTSTCRNGSRACGRRKDERIRRLRQLR